MNNVVDIFAPLDALGVRSPVCDAQKPMVLPCESLSRAEMTLLNAFHSTVFKKKFHIGQQSIECRLSRLQCAEYDWRFSIDIGGDTLCLGMGSTFINAVIEQWANGVAIEDLDEEILLGCVEAAISPLLCHAEDEFGLQCYVRLSNEIDWLNKDHAVSVSMLTYTNDSAGESLLLKCSNFITQVIFSAVDTLFGSFSDGVFDVPLLARVCVGSTDLLRRDYLALNVGDVILVRERSSPVRNQVVVMVGSQHFMNGVFDRNGIKIIVEDEGRIMNETSDDNGVDSVANLSVKLDFDVGSVEMKMSELSSIVEGYVIDLERKSEAIVSIRVGSKVIGYGDLLEINDSELAVRVVNLFEHQGE